MHGKADIQRIENPAAEISSAEGIIALKQFVHLFLTDEPLKNTHCKTGHTTSARAEALFKHPLHIYSYRSVLHIACLLF